MLEKLRESIDEIDNQIVDLINKRMEFVKKIGELKGVETKLFTDQKEKRPLLIDWSPIATAC